MQWVEDGGSKGTEEGEKAAVEEGLAVFSRASLLGRALLRLRVLLKLCNGQRQRQNVRCIKSFFRKSSQSFPAAISLHLKK